MTKIASLNSKSSRPTGNTLSGKLPTIFSLYQYPAVENIVVIGCGGTGAYVISHLARLISVANKTRRASLYGSGRHIRLFLADGDIVEEKNLIRQHFIDQDIGRNKAEVLGERYAGAFGIEIGVVPKDIESKKDLSFIQHRSGSLVVVGCVDNNASRQVIRDWFLGTKDGSADNMDYRGNYESRFWIDSGNEERHGQVVCGYRPSERGYYGSFRVNPFKEGRSLSGEFSLPCATEIYSNLLNEDQFNSQLSCAEQSESAPQNMQTNVTAATIVMNFLNKIIMNEPIKSHCVEFSIDNVFSTKLNTPQNLSAVNETRKRYWEKK